jgi:hypothetical protein
VKQDPLALAFFGAALALLAGLLLYVFVFSKPEPAPPAGTLDSLRKKVDSAVDKLRDKPAPAPAPVAKPAQAPKPTSSAPATIAAGHTWRYAVVVDPPAWRDITLTYKTRPGNGGMAVLTEFVHAGGRSDFNLGIFAPGHPSHENTRFPGFFMHPSYFRQPLEPGQKLSWGWAWQPAREGRQKRYEGRVLRWEEVSVPAGKYRAAVIEADLYYIEGGSVRAQAKETLWYAPQVAQIVKVVRDGRTPDEGSTRIVAELAEYR